MAVDKRIMLVVDDMELNRAILDELFHEFYHVIEASNGEEAIKLIGEYGKDIAIVLLDLIMPVMNGFQVLQEMSDRHLIKEIPVIMITSENSEQAILNGYNLGVSDVITKPFNPDIVRKRVENTVELNSYKLHLENKVNSQVCYIEKQAKELEKVNNFIIDTLSTIVEFRDLDSGQHVKRIRRLTKILLSSVAREHKEYGLTDEMIDTIASASAMHDIGKISIPDHILLKPGRLTAEEFEIMKTHTTKGCKLLDSLNYIHTSDYFKYSYDICRHHHERWDGKGYPDGLKGDEITIWAQVVALADVYDALTSSRVYKEAYSPETAIRMILNGECGTFNPMLIDVFMKSKEIIRLDEDLFSELPNLTDLAVNAIPDDTVTVTSISDLRERTLRLLELERKKYRILADLSGEVIFTYDGKKDIMEFSEKCREVLGCEECIENFLQVVKVGKYIHQKDQDVIGKIQSDLQGTVSSECVEIRIKLEDEYKWFEVQIYALSGEEEGPDHMMYIGKLTNINDRKLEKERLRIEANTDGLTGLANHKAAREKIDKSLSLNPQDNGALIFFDIDNFKQVNDTYGHLLGDEVLKFVGDALRRNFRKQDVQARVGGDEFVVFIRNYGNSQLLTRRLEDLRRLFDKVSLPSVSALKVSCSIGVSRYPEDGGSYQELFAKADTALYRSKERGKDQYTIYVNGMEMTGDTQGKVSLGLTKIDFGN